MCYNRIMKRIICLLILTCLLVLPLAGCAQDTPDTSSVDAYLATFTAGSFGIQNPSDPIVEFTFEGYGTVRVELYPSVAPISVNNFLRYVGDKFYDGTIMHRVIAGFMIQGGGYYLDGNTIMTKSTYAAITGEFSSNGVTNDVLHTAGVLSMARANNPNSATSQWFICSATASHLDGDYAAFGKVIDQESMAVVLAISQVETIYVNASFANFPYPPVTVTSVKRLK